LLPILLLLLGSVPVLALLVLLGGVDIEQVGQVTLITLAASAAAGSLGGLMAVWREQTFPALALTFLALLLYLGGIRFAEVFGWQAWLDPYQALAGVLNPPAEAPAAGFAVTMLGLSMALNGIAVWRLRAWNPSQRGARSPKREAEDEEKRPTPGAARGRPVWANPILWREVRTRAYGRGALLVRGGAVVVFGLIFVYGASVADDPHGRVPFAAAYGLVPAAIVGLLLTSTQAVLAITTERDKGALDLLLVTDVTPREFIFGKLGGIAYNALLFVLPVLLLAGWYATRGLLAPPRSGGIDTSRNVQALICVAGTLLALVAFVMVLGVHVGLRNENGRTAIVLLLGTVFFLSVGTLVCIGLIVINGRFEYQWGSFLLFLVAGVGGFWWVLNGERPSTALTIASWVCPFALFYAVLNVLIGQPGTGEAGSPWLPFLVIAAAFGLAVAAMLVPLLSEFDLALGRTGGGNE
jgi:hypothetical protein